jgi:hypothetical protein
MTDATMKKLSKIIDYLVSVQQDEVVRRLVGAVDQSAIDLLRKDSELVRQATARAEKLILRVVGDHIKNASESQLRADLGLAPAEAPEVSTNAPVTPPPETPISAAQPEEHACVEPCVERALSERTLTARKPKGTWKNNAERMKAYRERKAQQAKALETPPVAPAASPDVSAILREVQAQAVSVSPSAPPQEAVHTEEPQAMSVQAFLDLPEVPQDVPADPTPASPARPTPAAPAPLSAFQQDVLPPHVRRRLNELKASSPEPANEPSEPAEEVREEPAMVGRRNLANQIFGR